MRGIVRHSTSINDMMKILFYRHRRIFPCPYLIAVAIGAFRLLPSKAQAFIGRRPRIIPSRLLVLFTNIPATCGRYT